MRGFLVVLVSAVIGVILYFTKLITSDTYVLILFMGLIAQQIIYSKDE